MHSGHLAYNNNRWTLGSILFLSSFAAVMGPWAYVQHLTSTPRLPFTAAYFGSLGLTIYFSIGVSRLLRRLHSPPLLTCTSAAAPKYNPHDILRPYSTWLPNLVSGQLLSHGIERPSPCEQFWCAQSRDLDDRVEKSVSHAMYQTPLVVGFF